MINITNRRAKRLYQAEFERRMNVVENTFFKEIRPLLGRQFFNAAQLVQQGVGIEGVNHAVDLGRRRLIDIFKKHYKRVATVFSRRAYQIFEESKKSIYPDSYKQIDFAIELKGPKDEFWNSISKWSTTEAAKKIRGIQRTTKNVIARVIRKGMEEGESSVNIAKRIRKTSAAINPHRSKTIALTETHGAAVKSVDAAVASTRIEMEREWVSAKDMRTRTRDKGNRFEHYRSFPNGADGEKVAQDGKFVGTGQALDYPGDSKGSAGNVILCRCCLIYHTVRRTEQLKPHEPEEMPLAETQGGRLFKNEADAVSYNKYSDHYSKEKLTNKKMLDAIEVDCPEMELAFGEWKHDTNQPKCIALKMLVERVETKKTFAWATKADDNLLKEIEGFITNEFKDQYIKMRAMQQVYFKQQGKKKLKLYRGTDGETGEEMRNKCVKLKEKAKKVGKDWKKEKIIIDENSLVGYSRSEKVADDFGFDALGITTVRKIDVEDIVIDWDSIFVPPPGFNEKEVMILGGERKINLGSIFWAK